MFQCCNVKFSDLRSKTVYDRSGKPIGRVADFIVKLAGNRVELKSLVIAGSKKEEFMERIGLKPDDDPVFQLDCVDRIESDIHLAVEGSSLRTMLDRSAMNADDVKMSALTKAKVVDSDDVKVGNVIDIWFDTKDKIWLVLGGGFLEETLERIGAQPDIDLLVPEEAVESLTKKQIRLKWTKFQLEATCKSEYERYKREVATRHEAGKEDIRAVQMRLTGAPPRGFV
ncbi:MAG: PRC-barrel domain-containing protein [Candidatus Thorarchaeota archaeon]|nr:PRC-barrel domain-containing protein [Candidatus Thorarchaeota archaeon]